MEAIERDRLLLDRPSADRLRQAYSTIRETYKGAYDWTPPEDHLQTRESSVSMRSHVRRWINQWDLERLYPDYKPEISIRPEEVAIEYREDPNLEAADAQETADS